MLVIVIVIAASRLCHEDGHIDLPTLEVALVKLKEMIQNDQSDPEGPIYSGYGLSFGQTDSMGVAYRLSADTPDHGA